MRTSEHKKRRHGSNTNQRDQTSRKKEANSTRHIIFFWFDAKKWSRTAVAMESTASTHHTKRTNYIIAQTCSPTFGRRAHRGLVQKVISHPAIHTTCITCSRMKSMRKTLRYRMVLRPNCCRTTINQTVRWAKWVLVHPLNIYSIFHFIFFFIKYTQYMPE